MQTQASKSLRPKQAAEFLGIGLSTIWKWVKDKPDFPRPINLTPRVTAFDEAELVAWRDSHRAKN